MSCMYLLRRKHQSSQLQPDFRFIRTLQSPHHVTFDKASGLFRISSKAFGPSKSDGGLSGDLEQILEIDGLHATSMYPAVRDAVGAAAIKIGDIIASGCEVEHDPTLKNWYHGSVFKITGGKKKALHRAAYEIVKIDQTEAKRLYDQSEALLG